MLDQLCQQRTNVFTPLKIMSLKKRLRPVYRRLLSATVGDEYLDRIRPITWYNLSTWIWETVREDFEFYQPKRRTFSISQISTFLTPNLDRPIFIVGAPRSGTTFLGECIGTLSEVSYHFEPVLTKAATRYVYDSLWTQDFSKWFYRCVYAWLMRLHFDTDLHFAEKTPQISLVIPFLYKAFPNARFIHILRDGRDVALSLSKKPWYRGDMKGSGAKEPDGYPFGPKARFWVEPERVEEYEKTDDIHRCIWLWRRYIEIIFEAAPNLPEHQYHELRYEALVQNPEIEAERLINFLQITEPVSVDYFKQILIQRADSSSIGRWKDEYTPKQLERASQEAGKLLHSLNYVCENVSS